MSKIICKICGAEEESNRWIPETKEEVEKEQMCFSCLHWARQYRLDLTERGEHGWAVINGVHYVLCPHTDLNWPCGFGGVENRIRFLMGTKLFAIIFGVRGVFQVVTGETLCPITLSL